MLYSNRNLITLLIVLERTVHTFCIVVCFCKSYQVLFIIITSNINSVPGTVWYCDDYYAIGKNRTT